MARGVRQFAVGDNRVDGMLGGWRWDGPVVIGFPDSASDYPATYGVEPTSNFFQVSSEQQRVLREAGALIESYTNLRFSYSPGTLGDIAVGQTTGSHTPTAKAIYPGDDRNGDIWFGTNISYRTPRAGDLSYHTHLHELGHALGLKHPHEADSDDLIKVILAPEHDWSAYSLMSYRSYQGGPTGYSNETFGYSTTYMPNDILALQVMYGANYATRAENNVYTWNAATGQFFSNNVAAGPAPGSGTGIVGDATSNRVFMTIWDGGGEDEIDLSTRTTPLNLDLQPGGQSFFGAQSANIGSGRQAPNVMMSWLVNGDTRSLIENARGGSGNDTIAGNSAANKLFGNGGADSLNGRGGDDELDGGEGNDTLLGGDGADRLVGAGGDDTLLGEDGNDHLTGGVGDDTLTGGKGDDQLNGGAGNDTLLGGQGIDTAVFGYGLSGALIYTGFDNRVRIGGREGLDIVSAERIQFTDRVISLLDYVATDLVAPRITEIFDNEVLPETSAGATRSLSFNEIVSAGPGSLRIYYSDGALVRSYSSTELINDTSSTSFNIPLPAAPGNYYIEIDPGFAVDRSGNYLAGFSGPAAFNFKLGGSDDFPSPPTISPYSVAGFPVIGLQGLSTSVTPVVVNGYLNNAADTDYHRISFDPAKTYEIRFDLTAADAAVGASLNLLRLTKDGGYTTSSYKSYLTGNNLLVQQSSSEVLIGVDPGGAGSYRFTIREVGITDDFVDDLSSGTADSTRKIAVGAVVEGMLSAGTKYSFPIYSLDGLMGGTLRQVDTGYVGDTDWMKVDLLAGTTYKFMLASGAAAYSQYDSSGGGSLSLLRNYAVQRYSQGDTSLPVLASTASGSSAGGFTYTPFETGTYWLRVADGFGGYRVSVGSATAPPLAPMASGLALVSSSTSIENGTATITLNFNQAVSPGAGAFRITGATSSAIATTDATQVSWAGTQVVIRTLAERLQLGSSTLSIDRNAILSSQGSPLAAVPTVSLANNPSRTGWTATTATAAFVAPGDSLITSQPSGATWYKTNLIAGVTYDLHVIADFSSALTLRNSAGQMLAQDSAFSGGGTNSRLVFTPTTSGTYFLDVSGNGRIMVEAVPLSHGLERTGTAGADRITGTLLADRIEGGAGHDVIDGRAGNDLLFGGEGNDILAGGTGTDQIDGGGGIDTAVLGYAFTETRITPTATGYRLDGPQGSELVVGVERLQFTDRVVDAATLVVSNDPLIDDSWYLAQNPDVAAAGLSPDFHYNAYGWREGRDPNPLFSTKYYLESNPDVLAAGMNPLFHFDNFGWREGRNPTALFNTRFYLAANPDVGAAGMNPLLHYNNYGWREGRDPNALFETKAYLNANPDVRAAGLNPLQHYAEAGWREGRDPGLNFDTGLYLARHADVARAGMNPLEHFVRFGQGEGRQAFAAVGTISPGGFDRQFYLMSNPDVAAAGVDAYWHYSNHGWREGRDPNAFFDTNFYLAQNTDVRAAGIDPLSHYNQYGWREGRDPSAAFDTQFYRARHPDVAGAGMDPLFHYLSYGAGELRPIAGAVGTLTGFGFDAQFYLRANPDVAASGLDPLFHFTTYGWSEGRDPNGLFDTSAYLAANPDVRAAGLNPLMHYNDFGWREGRDAGLGFDTGIYLARNADVRASGLNPLFHFLQYGAGEGRAAHQAVGQLNSVLFDAKFYLFTNPDVAAAGVDPFQHFMNFGWREGRDPNALFDTNFYLANNVDVRAAGVNPLQHFVQHGWREGRDPSATFDTSHYLQQNPDVRAAGLNPLFHYLEYGAAEGRAPNGSVRSTPRPSASAFENSADVTAQNEVLDFSYVPLGDLLHGSSAWEFV